MLFNNQWPDRAREIIQLVKHMPHKHADLNLQHPGKRPGEAVIPVLTGQSQTAPRAPGLAGLAESVSLRPQ